MPQPLAVASIEGWTAERATRKPRMPDTRLVTRMTLRRSADDLPVPLAVDDSSTTSLPLLLGTGGSLHTASQALHNAALGEAELVEVETAYGVRVNLVGSLGRSQLGRARGLCRRPRLIKPFFRCSAKSHLWPKCDLDAVVHSFGTHPPIGPADTVMWGQQRTVARLTGGGCGPCPADPRPLPEARHLPRAWPPPAPCHHGQHGFPIINEAGTRDEGSVAVSHEFAPRRPCISFKEQRRGVCLNAIKSSSVMQSHAVQELIAPVHSQTTELRGEGLQMQILARAHRRFDRAHLAAEPLLRPEPSEEPPSSLTPSSVSDSVSSASGAAGHTAITAPACVARGVYAAVDRRSAKHTALYSSHAARRYP